MNKSTGNNWQQGEQGILNDLICLSRATQISESDEALLMWIVSDALGGIDVTKRYPAFYQRMLASPELQEAFLDALRTLEEGHNLEQIYLPGESPKETALFESLLGPLIERLSDQKMRITWRQGIAHLNAIFSPQPGPAYRSEETSLEDNTLSILRGKVQAGGLHIDLMFQTTQKVEFPQQLEPIVIIAIEPPFVSSHSDLSALVLSLKWGSYQANAEVDENGRASFPALPLSAILDASGERVIADLSLSLEVSTT